jgi:hypothetical protein
MQEETSLVLINRVPPVDSTRRSQRTSLAKTQICKSVSPLELRSSIDTPAFSRRVKIKLESGAGLTMAVISGVKPSMQ